MEIIDRPNQCDRIVLRKSAPFIATTSVCRADYDRCGYDQLGPALTGIGFHKCVGIALCSFMVSISTAAGIPGIWKAAGDGT